MKVKLELKSGQNVIVDMLSSTKLSKYFQLSELANNEGNRNQPQFILNSQVDEFLKMLDEFRVWFNRPIKPSCGYRQPDWNANVGGIKDSLHLKALAIDVPFSPMTDTQWNNIANKWNSICKAHNTVGECGRYNWGFHLGAFITYSKNYYRFDKR